ncbi:Twin-arginine translocation pathway signal [Sphingobium lactosutens]|uniref:gluconate 2-dehydrogenase subunit 3 family protein n=1 Tax=Sphingobium lactosutens TaxID=522773 RepID=UPI0015BDD0B4|nr:gluconate 2-dehydrogenase subunit 3 family protein [Sphingobium lactosutens]NWK94454.1 Twin-arginine translocation pathway signal [Sphingobium lactosutens]
MRTIDRIDVVSRRSFIGVAALVAGAPTIVGAPAFAATTTLTIVASATLTRMARDLYPHDRLSDEFYSNAIASIAEQLSQDAATAQLLTEGAAMLDSEAVRRSKFPYAKLTLDADRLAVLNAISSSTFFSKMRAGLITALYNQSDLWSRFGYEGSSAEKGGYLHRGFNDLEWLPNEAPSAGDTHAS